VQLDHDANLGLVVPPALRLRAARHPESQSTNSPIPISVKRSPALIRFPALFARRFRRKNAKPTFSRPLPALRSSL